MKARLKKLKNQVIVITGATSGIGLVTARMAAKRGARLVLAARSQDALQQLTSEIEQGGGRAIHVVADVGKQEDVHEIVQAAQGAFGGFDTWVNDAGISIYGKLEDVPMDDMRHLFETNFWGLVYGSLEAARHLKGRIGGGALINIGSTLSDRAIPLQGMYCASKHAVKGFTDALRMELEEAGAPVSVTLIKPGAIDTPYTRHAKNYLEVEPMNPPPIYAPETVARVILHCDIIMESLFFGQQKSDRPPRPREHHALDRPSGRLDERGGHRGHVAESSLYTNVSLHPVLTGVALIGAGLAVSALWRARPDGGNL